MNDDDKRVALRVATSDDLPTFTRELQDAFELAVRTEFDLPAGERIPPDRDIDQSFHAPGAVAYHILSGDTRVGGAIVTIDQATQNNSLDLFFIAVGAHGRGLGHAAWQAIERQHPQTRTWRTYTPYFERRNIHFYVNKCGFKIVEFFNVRHTDPNRRSEPGLPDDDGFIFEKVC